ncbi:MAG: hypothetical protein ACK522_00345 [Synechococcaceae cyanobacterium]
MNPQLKYILAALGLSVSFHLPASAATFNVTEAEWGASSTVGSFAWAIDQANKTPGLDVISLQAAGGLINVDNATTLPSIGFNTFIGSFTDSVQIEGNNIRLEGDPVIISSGGIIFNKTNPSKPSQTDVVVRNAYSFGRVADGVSIQIKNLVVDGLNGFLEVGKNAAVSVSNTIFRNSVPYFANGFNNYEPQTFIQADDGTTINLDKVILEKLNPFFEGISQAEYAFDAAIAASKAVINISDSIIRGSSTTYGAVNLLGGTANIVSSVITGSAGGLSVSDFEGVDGVMNVVNSLLKFENPMSSAIARIQAFAGGEANLTATTIQANGLYLDTSFSGCSVPSSDPNYLCNGSPLQAFSGGTIRLKESAVSAINMDLVDVQNPYSETYAPFGNPSSGDLLSDANSYVQPTATLSGQELQTLFNQPGLLTDGVPYVLDASGLFYSPLPEGAVPAGPLLAVILDADGANQLINPIDGSVITKDVYGNPRTAFGTRDIGAVQGTQDVPGPLPVLGAGAAFGWARRLRKRVRQHSLENAAIPSPRG